MGEMKTQKDMYTVTIGERRGWSGEEAEEAVRDGPQKHHCSFHEPALSKGAISDIAKSQQGNIKTGALTNGIQQSPEISPHTHTAN